ncbi:hypothetical protein ABIF90_008117 [Bradyrhizobium japonicum]
MSTDEQASLLKFQISEDLRGKLDGASAENGRSLAEEVRQRLIGSFRSDADRKTRDLVEELFLLAFEVKLEVGDDWHANDRARATFAAAVAEHINSYGKGNKPIRKDSETVPAEPEETIVGRTIARLFRRRTTYQSHRSDSGSAQIIHEKKLDAIRKRKGP